MTLLYLYHSLNHSNQQPESDSHLMHTQWVLNVWQTMTLPLEILSILSFTIEAKFVNPRFSPYPPTGCNYVSCYDKTQLQRI